MARKQSDNKEVNYQQLTNELDQIIANLQNDTLGIDEVLQQYERGQIIAAELKLYLKKAENKIIKINKKDT